MRHPLPMGVDIRARAERNDDRMGIDRTIIAKSKNG